MVSSQYPTCTETSLRTVIAQHGGVLHTGAHAASADGPCCILEARSVCLGVDWTDAPTAVGLPDLRPLNDSVYWPSDQARTEAMIALAVAYDGWARWTPERRQAVIARIVVETVRQVIVELPGLSGEVREQCRQVRTLHEARAAAAEAAEAAEAAAWAARAAAWAAEAAAAAWAAEAAAAWAAEAAARAAHVLTGTVALWIAAAVETPDRG